MIGFHSVGFPRKRKGWGGAQVGAFPCLPNPSLSSSLLGDQRPPDRTFLEGGPEWSADLGARRWGPWVWQPFMPGEKKQKQKTVGLAQSDLDLAQSSPASLFPGEASVPAGSCNLLPPLGAAASSLLPFPERC